MTERAPQAAGARRAPVAPALVEALVHHQRALGAGPRAEAAAAALGTGARVVVTGQQPGLLGGPLLVLHKALCALAEARRRSSDEHRLVAVFFVASDDHDWDEANQCTVLDAEGQPHVLSLPGRADGRSVADLEVSAADVAALRDRLASRLPRNDFLDETLALTDLPTGPTDLARWFQAILPRVLGDTGLVFVTPRLLAPFAADLLGALVSEADAVNDAVRSDGAALAAAGRAAPLSPRPGEAPLFLRPFAAGPRQRIGFDGERVTLRGLPSGHTRASLRALVREAPHLASADVVGRVLLQDALLPVEAVVAGPSEAAYLAQTAGAHRVLGLAMPAIVARPSAAWVDARSVEALRAVGLSPEAVLDGATGPEAGTPAGGPSPAPAGDEVERRLAALAEEMTAVLADLAGSGDRERETRRALEAARRTLDGARDVRRRGREDARAQALRRVHRAVALLRPRGRPQERVLSPLAIVSRHGLVALRRHTDDLASWRATTDDAGPRVVVVAGSPVASGTSPTAPQA